MSIEDTLSNRYFLVVDDEEFIRTLVTRYLQQAGAAGVVEAANGREALAAIKTSDVAFDAIVSDIGMEPVNGLELLRTIRTGGDGLHRNLRVVLLTAHADAECVATALLLDADAFVVKPVGRDELVERVLRTVERPLPIAAPATYVDVAVNASIPVAVPTAPAPSELPRGAVKTRLGLVPANAVLAIDVSGSDGGTLLHAGTVLNRGLLARLDDLRKVHPALRDLAYFAPTG